MGATCQELLYDNQAVIVHQSMSVLLSVIHEMDGFVKHLCVPNPMDFVP